MYVRRVTSEQLHQIGKLFFSKNSRKHEEKQFVKIYQTFPLNHDEAHTDIDYSI